MSNVPLEHRFEGVVRELFRALDFRVTSPPLRQRTRPDFIVEWGKENGQTIRSVIEVKLYRSRYPSLALLRKAVEFVDDCRGVFEADHGVLVVNLRKGELAPLPSDKEQVYILDLDDLISLASGHDAIVSELIDVDRELSSSLRDFDRPAAPIHSNARAEAFKLRSQPPERPPSTPARATPGGDLCAKLRATPPGRKSFTQGGVTKSAWRHFEDVCEEAIKLLFSSQFRDWTKQKIVGENGRYDVMAKVVGVDVFSRTLIEDFRSRHVLFEFKNYGGKLKPNLVHITEKYLFPTALRATAIIISPKGPSAEALYASRGALRDAGKLVLHLDVDQVCEMLHAYDDGSVPSLYLETHLDAFLRSVER